MEILIAAIRAAAVDILKDWLKNQWKKLSESMQQNQTSNDNTIIGGNLDVTI